VTGGGFGTVCTAEGTPLPGIAFAAGNEEHGFLTGPGTAGLAVGDLLRIVPNHACATVNMWSTLYALRDDRAVAQWAIEARR
jgi:D-serine deaminase-like pyridoxal phosphate-dependent protein